MSNSLLLYGVVHFLACDHYRRAVILSGFEPVFRRTSIQIGHRCKEEEEQAGAHVIVCGNDETADIRCDSRLLPLIDVYPYECRAKRVM